MTVQSEQVAHPDLVGGGQTNLHSHAGGGGADVKSGTTTTSGGSGSVTFNSPFTSTPQVVVTPQDGVLNLRDCLFVIRSVDVNGFSFEVDADATYDWIATDAGNP